MAYEESQKRITLNADASIGILTGVPGMPGSTDPNYGKQYTWVKVTGDRQAGLATAAAGEQPVGVLQNKPQHVGDASTVAISGETKLMTGTGGLTAGDKVKTDSTGRGVTATGSDPVYGVTIHGESGVNKLATVLIVI